MAPTGILMGILSQTMLLAVVVMLVAAEKEYSYGGVEVTGDKLGVMPKVGQGRGLKLVMLMGCWVGVEWGGCSASDSEGGARGDDLEFDSCVDSWWCSVNFLSNRRWRGGVRQNTGVDFSEPNQAYCDGCLSTVETFHLQWLKCGPLTDGPQATSQLPTAART